MTYTYRTSRSSQAPPGGNPTTENLNRQADIGVIIAASASA